MRVVLLVGLALVVSASELVNLPKSYHDEIGFPEARRIKAYEDSILNNQQAQPGINANRIVGGVTAPVSAHPYLAGLIISLLNVNGNSVCGASLLSANRLVTAAHCWSHGSNQAWQFVVVLGSHFLFYGGVRIATNQVVMHPNYVPSMLFNDVAMIYLPTRVTFSTTIQPVSLPSTWELSNNFVGQWAVAAGYGRISDQQLGVSTNTMVSHVDLRVISEEECRATYVNNVLPSTLCTSGTGGVGVCGGDSGGPLVINRWGRTILVGVSSFTAQINNVAVCQRGFPSGFARVTSFYSFINQHL